MTSWYSPPTPWADAYPSLLAARDLIRAHGTEAQIAALTTARTPGAVKRLCREILFRPLANFPRWQRIEPSDIPHAESCRGGEIRFAVRSIDTWCPPDPEEWGLILHATGSIGRAESITIHNLARIPRRHTGLCTCGGKKGELSALVSFYWAAGAMRLSREYAL